MQGSHREMAMCDQGYRTRIADAVRRRHPEVEIVDPFVLHPGSMAFGREQAVETFLSLLDMAAGADLLVAYLPRASLGTALEIGRAFDAGKPVIAISPMDKNWMLWATTRQILPDLDAFDAFVDRGGLTPYLGAC